jgi:transposase
VAARLRCPRCGAEKSWILKGGRRRCAKCRYDWTPGRLLLRLTAQAWRDLLRWFVRGATSAQIAHETRLDRKRVLRALTAVRKAIIGSLPHKIPSTSRASAGLRTQEAQDVGAQKWTTRPRPRFPALGLYLVNGEVGADVLSDDDTEQLGRILRVRKTNHATTPPQFRRYAAVVYRRRFYRFPTAGHRTTAFGTLEAFWAYLQRHLRAKGGIRRERLDLYVAEYVWRYNRRQLTPEEQVKELLNVMRQRAKGGRNGTFTHDETVGPP